MSMNGFISFNTVNGVQEFTTVNDLVTNASAIDESILIYGVGTIGVTTTSPTIATFLRCNIHIEDPTPATQWFNISEASLTYNATDNNRFSTASAINFEDCSIVFNAPSIRAIFLSNCTNTRVFNAGSTMLTYTQEFANINFMHLENTNWEVNGQPSEASNIKLVNSKITNFLVPRLDFSYIDISVSGTNLTMATGNGGNVSCYFWNSIAFDNTQIDHQSINNEYFDGISASWNFKDRDSGLDVEDVLLINSSDKSGSMTELGRYTTNSDGLTVGTYDSRFEVTGASQVRDALFLFENYSDMAGSTHGGTISYDIIPIINRVEVRSYLHQAPPFFMVGDDYPLTTPQGSLSSDYTTDEPAFFTLNNDLNITEADKAVVLLYTDLETINKLYDRHKAEWRDNDNYALIDKNGSQLSLGTIDLILDGTEATVYASTPTSITTKSTTFTGGIITAVSGTVIVRNGALLLGGTFNCNIDYESGAGATLLNVTCTEVLDLSNTGTYTFDGGTISELTNSSGGAITIQLTKNTGPNITIVQNVNVAAPSLIDGTRVQLWNITKGSELDNSIVTGGSGYSFEVNLFGGAQDIGDTLRLRTTQIDGVTAMLPTEDVAILTTTGLAYLTAQDSDSIYDANAIDGSTVTKFTADYANNEVDITTAVDFTGVELYARFVYFTSTSDGIRNFFGGFTAIDAGNFLNDVTVLDFFINNNTAVNLKQIDNVRLYKSNDVYPVKNPTTGGGGIDIVWRKQVFVIETDTTGLTPTESAQLDSIDSLTRLIPATL